MLVSFDMIWSDHKKDETKLLIRHQIFLINRKKFFVKVSNQNFPHYQKIAKSYRWAPLKCSFYQNLDLEIHIINASTELRAPFVYFSSCVRELSACLLAYFNLFSDSYASRNRFARSPLWPWEGRISSFVSNKINSQPKKNDFLKFFQYIVGFFRYSRPSPLFPSELSAAIPREFPLSTNVNPNYRITKITRTRNT